MSDLQQLDTELIWHPYTHQKDRLPAIPIVSGKGTKLFDEAGNSYIDAVSSWWVNLHGHAHPYIAEKIFEQALQLQQVIFTSFTHAPAVNLAKTLLPLLPGDFSKIFYSDNGSTATEVAIKMAIQYWQNKGDNKRDKILAFHNSYHGDTFGAMSISERSVYTYAFRDKLFQVLFIDYPEEKNADTIINAISRYENEITCIIYEPLLQGAGGMLMYAPDPLNQLLGYLKSRGILLISDEVLTGFYRTGRMFAGDYMNTKADIICLSKGLTGGNMAMGATCCSEMVYAPFVSDDRNKTLFHGHSFTANALGCATALASLELLQKEECRKNIETIINSHVPFIKRLREWESKKVIKNVRQLGTVIAFEGITKHQDGYLNPVADTFAPFCMERGVYLRAMGNCMYILPPYCITQEELQQVYDTIIEYLEESKNKWG